MSKRRRRSKSKLPYVVLGGGAIGVIAYLAVQVANAYVPIEGEGRNPVTCWDGSTVYQEIYHNGSWVPNPIQCPTEPAEGSTCSSLLCGDGSTIITGIWSETTHSCKPTGASCPIPLVCTPGSYRNQTLCSDGTYAGGEQCSSDGMSWIPTGTTCPLPQICTPGALQGDQTICSDGTPVGGHICTSDGMSWIPYSETTCPLPIRWTWMAAPTSVAVGVDNTYTIRMEVAPDGVTFYNAASTRMDFVFSPVGGGTSYTSSCTTDSSGMCSVIFRPPVTGDWTVVVNWDHNNHMYSWEPSPVIDISVLTSVGGPIDVTSNIYTTVQPGGSVASALAACPAGQWVKLAPGTFSGPIIVPANKGLCGTVVGGTVATTITGNNATYNTMWVAANSGSTVRNLSARNGAYFSFAAHNVNDVTFMDCDVDYGSPRDEYGCGFYLGGPPGNYLQGTVDNINLTRCVARNCPSYGFLGLSNSVVSLTNWTYNCCDSINNGMVQVNGVNKFGCGFDFIENVGGGGSSISNMQVVNCTANDNADNGFHFQDGDTGTVDFASCTAIHNGHAVWDGYSLPSYFIGVGYYLGAVSYTLNDCYAADNFGVAYNSAQWGWQGRDKVATNLTSLLLGAGAQPC